jgi:hypothetical protein
VSFVNPGVTITIKSESQRSFVIGARRLRNCQSGIGLPPIVTVAPGESIHVFEPPPGIVLTLKDRARNTRQSGTAAVSNLAALAREAYGERWEEELQKRTGKTERQIRRWLSGATRIPGPVLALVSAHVVFVRNKLPLP